MRSKHWKRGTAGTEEEPERVERRDDGRCKGRAHQIRIPSLQ